MTDLSCYLGLPYQKSFDCLDFVCLAYREKFNKTVPDIHNHGHTTLDQQRQILKRMGDYCIELDTPKNPCLVLLRQGSRIRHIGIYYMCRNRDYIIHNSPFAGHVVQSRPDRMLFQGYEVCSYLDWKT